MPQEHLTKPQESASFIAMTMPSTEAKLNFRQLWNMSFGMLGIQSGWGLQIVNMSAIFEHLGAYAHQIPILWIAAPLTGLVIQPIVGNLSDYTWGPLGRRRPYFLVGAILASIALVLMPQSSTLWMAAGLLWLLDTAANISMVPFRAFVGDLLPKEQRTWGFAMQSLMIGIGSVLASALPWILNHWFAIEGSNPLRKIPLTVELSFYIGAVVFLGTVLWTVVTTPEHPPQDLEAFAKLKEHRGNLMASFRETWQALRQMPETMQQLAWVQFFTWLGIFCFFLYFPLAVAWNIFGATSQDSSLYNRGVEWAGLCFAVYNTVCIGFSFVLPYLARRTSRRTAHSICLFCGGIGLISLLFIKNQYLLLISMVGVGIAWTSVLALPYAMLVGAMPPQRLGIYMGIFNFFVVLPEILASLGFGWVMKTLLNNDRLMAVVLGGVFLLVAAVLTQFVNISPISGSMPETDKENTVKGEKQAHTS